MVAIPARDICNTKLPRKFETGICTNGVTLSSLHRVIRYTVSGYKIIVDFQSNSLKSQ